MVLVKEQALIDRSDQVLNELSNQVRRQAWSLVYDPVDALVWEQVLEHVLVEIDEAT